MINVTTIQVADDVQLTFDMTPPVLKSSRSVSTPSTTSSGIPDQFTAEEEMKRIYKQAKHVDKKI